MRWDSGIFGRRLHFCEAFIRVVCPAGRINGVYLYSSVDNIAKKAKGKYSSRQQVGIFK